MSLYKNKTKTGINCYCFKTSNLQYTQKEYYDWLTNKLKSLHEEMKVNRIEVKQKDKAYYDKYGAILLN